MNIIHASTKSHATIFGMSPGELVPLALYFAQQFGIMLGVGASTLFLIAYLVAMRDGVVESIEAQFARVLHYVLEVGLICIVLSGAVITAMHAMAGQYEVISTPAYFFKWLLIAFVSLGVVVRRATPFAPLLWEGIIGATWYALFILHITAPITFWSDLLFLYTVWIVGFMLLWIILAKLITAHKVSTPTLVSAAVPSISSSIPKPVPVPKPIPSAPKEPLKVQQPTPPPPPMPKPEPKLPVSVPSIPPVSGLPVVTHAGLAAPHAASPVPIKTTVPVKPPPPAAGTAPIKPKELVVAQNISTPVPLKPEALIKNTDDSDEIPHIYVMPRTPEDAQRHLRSAELQFT